MTASNVPRSCAAYPFTVSTRFGIRSRRRFSCTSTQTLASDPLGPVIAWMRANLRAPLDVATVAHRAGMSVRTLHRSCLQALDLTPAKLVEKLRVEHARSLLTTTRLGTKVVAARSGFGSTPRMSRAFQRALGVTPGAYRLMFSRDSGATTS